MEVPRREPGNQTKFEAAAVSLSKHPIIVSPILMAATFFPARGDLTHG